MGQKYKLILIKSPVGDGWVGGIKIDSEFKMYVCFLNTYVAKSLSTINFFFRYLRKTKNEMNLLESSLWLLFQCIQVSVIFVIKVFLFLTKFQTTAVATASG